jgi:hypothetical protein
MLHAASHYELPIFDLPLESSLIMSRMVYYFASVRDIVRDHAANIDDNKDLTEEEIKERGGLVKFDMPALVWTQDTDYKVFPSTYMHNPITFPAIIDFLERNRKYIKQDEMTDYPTFVPDGSNTTPQAMLQVLDDMAEQFDADIIDFDDQFSENALETELIFSVIVNRSAKTISVIYRGTVNTKDMSADANFVPRTHPLVEKVTDNGAKVHSGFLEYICKHTDLSDGDSQFDNIFRILKEVYAYKDQRGRDYSDYKLVLTGHSLGGALAQLSSFLIAGNPDASFIPSPVEAITYASPVCGEEMFFRAYRKLEKEGRLRHIRISNDKDIITGNPFWHYVQTGVNIHLFENKVAEVAYKNTRHCVSLLSSDPMGRHAIFEEGGYYERLYDKDADGKFINSHILGETVEQLYETYAGLDKDDNYDSCVCQP